MTSPEAFPSWVDGELVAPGAPAIPTDDLGFAMGVAAFDTLLLRDGVLWFEDRHLARLERGARGIRIPWPPPRDPARGLRELAREVGLDPLVVRVTVSRGSPGGAPRVVVTAREHRPPPEEGVIVALARHKKLAGDPLEALKTTDRLRLVLAREEAALAGADEALIATHEGDWSEATSANLLAVVDGTLVAPGRLRASLPGTVRDAVLEAVRRSAPELPVREDELSTADLERATELLLTNTTGGVFPVREVLGLEGNWAGASGPVLRELRALLAAAEREWGALHPEAKLRA